MKKMQKEWTKKQNEEDLNTKSANAFGGTFVFFFNALSKAKKIQKSHQANAQNTLQTMDNTTTTDRRPACNRRLAQWRVTWLIEHSTSHQLLWCNDSFVLRNPPLRQAPNRFSNLIRVGEHVILAQIVK
jgi:hypothetical protein